MAVEAKICGITRPGDAALAAAHGAWRIGVIFAGGPRLIEVSRAREIVAAAGQVPVIGVFGDQRASEIAETAASAGLTGVQLHRPATTAETLALRDAGLEVWRMVPVGDEGDLGAGLLEAAASADLLLLEPRHPEGGGGHGRPIDLLLAARARARVRGTRVGLAGGLTPEGVAEAIRVVMPDVVDVSSGVEVAPGIKDPGRLIRFLESVRDTGSAT